MQETVFTTRLPLRSPDKGLSLRTKDKVMECSRKGCSSIHPHWIPVLNVWPKGVSQFVPKPTQIPFKNIVLCDDHMKETNVDNLVGEEGWKTIKASFFYAGQHFQPDPSSAMLTWIDTRKAFKNAALDNNN